MALSISSNFEEAIEKTVHSYTNGQISIHQIADYANNSSQSFILTCGECKEQKRISVLSIDTTKTFLSNAVADFYKEHRHEHGPTNYGFTTFQCLHCLTVTTVKGKHTGPNVCEPCYIKSGDTIHCRKCKKKSTTAGGKYSDGLCSVCREGTKPIWEDCKGCGIKVIVTQTVGHEGFCLQCREKKAIQGVLKGNSIPPEVLQAAQQLQASYNALPEDFVVGKALGGKPNFDHSLNEKKLNTSSAPKKTVEKVPIVTLENHRAFRDD